MDQAVSSKQSIMNYVQSMEELETREFTLRKAAEELQKEVSRKKQLEQSMLDKSYDDLEKSNYHLKQAEEYYSETVNPPDFDKHENRWTEYKAKKSAVGRFFNKFAEGMRTPERVKKVLDEHNWKIEREPIAPPVDPTPEKPANYDEFKDKTLDFPELGFYILGIIGFAILFGVIGLTMIEITGIPFAILQLTLFIIASSILLGIYRKKDKRWKDWFNVNRYIEKCSLYERAKFAYENIYLPMFYLNEALKHEIARREQSLALCEVSGPFLEAQAQTLLQQADIIATQKAKIYQLGIVPPDYRTLDCVIMLNSIFKNDLADTMRDAILLYDERVFRGEVLKGIQKIYDMLGKLASSMRAIESHLMNVRQEVKDMTAEMRGIASELHEHKHSLEDMVKESRATRYAAESLQRSNELLLMYEREKR